MGMAWTGGILGVGQFPSKTQFYPITKIHGRSKKLRTTRGVIFRSGSEPIYLDKSAPNHQTHVPTNILKIVSNICPYIGLEIPLRGLSNSCVMFLGVPPVISTLGNPRWNIVVSARWRAFTSPENHQFGSHPNPLKPEPQLYSHSLT